MSKIDLSKAKIGDKFRAREGRILLYDGEDFENRDDKYKLIDEKGYVKHFFQYGEYLYNEESYLDLVEQVFDDEKMEREIKSQKEMQEAVGIEDEAELQRRQEVVELAEKLVTNELFAVTNHIHDMRELGAAINLDSPTEYAFLIAEEFVSTREKYLKEGKL